jgi:beclin 1
LQDFFLYLLCIGPLASEEQHEKEAHIQRALQSSTKIPPKPISSRFVGIKPPPLAPSPSPSQYKRDSFPASADSFVVLPPSKSNTEVKIAPVQQPIQATNPVSTSTSVEEDPNWSRNNTLSHRLRVANRVFDIMSSKSSVDHPMCQECTDMLLESLEKQMTDVGRERDCYIEFMKKVKDSRVTKEEEEELAKQVEEVYSQPF